MAIHVDDVEGWDGLRSVAEYAAATGLGLPSLAALADAMAPLCPPES